ncbi:hypothetical protein FH972_025800 [Carpinus fangiana]|uniref:N-acetyltransferase domain-containing protein n=1 Tax=Carpinus fangiana TaxID=176857 RepID=A0A5N6L2H1_9ROSI|nr:hypothetical protein FH972_025800 [Carpinus fangiana]
MTLLDLPPDLPQSVDPKLQLHKVTTREELDAIIPLEWATYHNPYRPEYQFLHPVFGPTPADRGAALAADRALVWGRHVANPASHWIYVTDSTTGDLLGATEWLFYDRNPFPQGPQRVTATWWPEGEGREFASELVTRLYRPRMAWCQRAFAALNATAVHPAHRRRGVGTLLMAWGVKRIDELGLDSLIEATDAGRALYERHGYRWMLTVTTDMAKQDASDEWRAYHSQLGNPSQHILWRPKGGDWDVDGPKAPWEVKA